MNIALIGATGFVGQPLLQELLSRGHQVRALQRDTAKLTPRPGLDARAVDVLNGGDLAAALAGVDAVVSAFNAGWGNPNLHDDFLRGSELIANAARDAGVRLIVVGGAGSLYIAPGQQLVDSPDFPAEWKSGALAAREVLNRLRADTTPLDWTFVSPAIMLVPGERTGQFRLGTESPVFDAQGESRISVADLAVAIVNELEAPQHRRGRFTAGY
ncbi:NAD(P)-dependent oxidoreductase [Roseateles cellulosilyticus]|uniref:NAD(P)-dependent oxidoreductase n=1 Tax=Pelomonas cellulosilytica TaxID=2906762 RepID=A0ABS8XXX3_9BURK|nr:NAD(P)-dependent oxidoreductase [Pelomonas sp. P8]MCE4556672.1 NAD(P)-dependent oxidoreductase [Pelomonas sp. P8]